MVHKKKLTQWGSQILMSILMSHKMVMKNPQNVHRKYFWAVLVTFTYDVKIDVNICEPHYVNLLFFLWTSSIVQMFDISHLFDNLTSLDIFLTIWHLFDIFTQIYNLNHLSPSQGYFYSSSKPKHQQCSLPGWDNWSKILADDPHVYPVSLDFPT